MGFCKKRAQNGGIRDREEHVHRIPGTGSHSASVASIQHPMQSFQAGASPLASASARSWITALRSRALFSKPARTRDISTRRTPRDALLEGSGGFSINVAVRILADGTETPPCLTRARSLSRNRPCCTSLGG